MQVWQRRAVIVSQELEGKGAPNTKIRVLRAFQVYDETLADQFKILEGQVLAPFW